MARKTALAAWIGSALEYYDFFIYGTAAALVFNKVFFPAADPATGTLLALATFGVGYLARPLGAFVLGHVGDRFGRKKVLVFTLLLMGVATFAVGCLPTYASIGVLAPVLLVVLRLLQGLSASGEQAGANSMSLEHAPEHRRAYFTSFTLSGTQAGQILATAIFLPVAALPQEDLLSWGWRVPFWCSAVVVIVGLVIRRKIDETAAFKRTKVAKLPVATLFRTHWVDVLRVVLAATIASVSTIFTVYALSYAVNTIGLARTSMLWVGVLANVVALAAIPLLARLSDKVGRKPVFLAGCGACAILIFLGQNTAHLGKDVPARLVPIDLSHQLGVALTFLFFFCRSALIHFSRPLLASLALHWPCLLQEWRTRVVAPWSPVRDPVRLFRACNLVQRITTGCQQRKAEEPFRNPQDVTVTAEIH